MRSRMKNMKFKKLIIRTDSAVALRNSWTVYAKYFVLNKFLYYLLISLSFK